MDSAAPVHTASLDATLHLTRSLVDSAVKFDIGTHLAVARDAGQASRSGRLEREQRFLNVRASDSPADGRRNKRNCASGVWLTVVPSRLNGTSISADEWRDNVRLRYNHLPLDMPQQCDGCNERMTVEHDVLLDFKNWLFTVLPTNSCWSELKQRFRKHQNKLIQLRLVNRNFHYPNSRYMM